MPRPDVKVHVVLDIHIEEDASAPVPDADEIEDYVRAGIDLLVKNGFPSNDHRISASFASISLK